MTNNKRISRKTGRLIKIKQKQNYTKSRSLHNGRKDSVDRLHIKSQTNQKTTYTIVPANCKLFSCFY
jgi:hypothetical protein